MYKPNQYSEFKRVYIYDMSKNLIAVTPDSKDFKTLLTYARNTLNDFDMWAGLEEISHCIVCGVLLQGKYLLSFYNMNKILIEYESGSEI